MGNLGRVAIFAAYAGIFIALLSLFGCALRHHDAHFPLHPATDPLHPIQSEMRIQIQVGDELATTRRLAMAGMGLGIMSALILRSISGIGAGVAVSGVLACAGVYATALLVAFTLPWLPWVALGLIVLLISLAVLYWRAHTAPICAIVNKLRGVKRGP